VGEVHNVMHMYRSFVNLTVKTALKFIDF